MSWLPYPWKIQRGIWKKNLANHRSLFLDMPKLVPQGMKPLKQQRVCCWITTLFIMVSQPVWNSEQDANFESNLIKMLCKIAGVEKSRTTPYHLMGNGQVERFYQILGGLSTNFDWVAAWIHVHNITKNAGAFTCYMECYQPHSTFAEEDFQSQQSHIVRKRAEIRKRYHQAPHQTQETNG